MLGVRWILSKQKVFLGKDTRTNKSMRLELEHLVLELTNRSVFPPPPNAYHMFGEVAFFWAMLVAI